jgi:hypothetical protein
MDLSSKFCEPAQQSSQKQNVLSTRAYVFASVSQSQRKRDSSRTKYLLELLNQIFSGNQPINPNQTKSVSPELDSRSQMVIFTCFVEAFLNWKFEDFKGFNLQFMDSAFVEISEDVAAKSGMNHLLRTLWYFF